MAGQVPVSPVQLKWLAALAGVLFLLAPWGLYWFARNSLADARATAATERANVETLNLAVQRHLDSLAGCKAVNQENEDKRLEEIAAGTEAVKRLRRENTATLTTLAGLRNELNEAQEHDDNQCRTKLEPLDPEFVRRVYSHADRL